MYSAVHGFWPVLELADLADGPTGRGEVSKGWVFVCFEVQCDEFNPIMVAVRTRPIMTCRCVSDSLLAYGLKIPPAKNRALHYNSTTISEQSYCFNVLRKVRDRRGASFYMGRRREFCGYG